MATITRNMTNKEYREVDAISKSDLDLINKSPALIEWSKKAPREQSDVADIGNAVHAALLEPDIFWQEFRKIPKFDRRTKEGKAAAEAFEATAGTKTLLSADDYDQVIAMRDSVLAHPVAEKLLKAPGISEASIFFEIDGVKCKCRPDRIVYHEYFGHHILIDVKTCDDIDRFAQSIRDYRYYVQDAFYSCGYAQLTGCAPRFVFVVVGKRKTFGRHQVRVFELQAEDKSAGEAAYLADLGRWNEASSFGIGLDIEQIKMAKTWTN